MGVAGKKKNDLSPASAKSSVGQDAKIAFDLDGAVDASTAFHAAAQRRRRSLPSGWFATSLLRKSRYQTSAYASAGRPPRHPKRKVSKYEEANAPAFYRRDLDAFINEKYPTAEVRDVSEKTSFNNEAEIKPLTDDDFRSLLGVEILDNARIKPLTNDAFPSLLGVEEPDNATLVLSGPRKRRRESSSHLQCLDIWD